MFHRLKRPSERLSSQAIKIPFRKKWDQEAVVKALRDTVPRPSVAIPWAEGSEKKEKIRKTQRNILD